jgi:hypothetical protein
MKKKAKKAKRLKAQLKRVAIQGKCVVTPKGKASVKAATLSVVSKEKRDALRVMHKPGEAGSAVASRKLRKNFTGKNAPVNATPRQAVKRTKPVMGEVLGEHARRDKTLVPCAKVHAPHAKETVCAAVTVRSGTIVGWEVKHHEDGTETVIPRLGAVRTTSFRKPDAVAIDRSGVGPRHPHLHDSVISRRVLSAASKHRSTKRAFGAVAREEALSGENDIQKAKRYAKVKARLEEKAVRKAALAKPASGVRPCVWLKGHPGPVTKTAMVHPNGPYAPRWAA